MHWRTSRDPGNWSRPAGYNDGFPQGEPAGDPWRTDGRLAIAALSSWNPCGFLPQMASEEIDQQFVVLIFYLAVHAVTLSLVEMDFRSPAMPLQSVPQAACHLDRPGLVSSAVT